MAADRRSSREKQRILLLLKRSETFNCLKLGGNRTLKEGKRVIEKPAGERDKEWSIIRVKAVAKVTVGRDK